MTILEPFHSVNNAACNCKLGIGPSVIYKNNKIKDQNLTASL